MLEREGFGLPPCQQSGVHLGGNGYVYIWAPDHPRASVARGYVAEHILVAEKALGRPLPPKAVVHHVDQDRANNANRNLVVCQNATYHALLHSRQRALRACGNPKWLRCKLCGKYGDPETEMGGIRNGRGRIAAFHLRCRKRYPKQLKG